MAYFFNAATGNTEWREDAPALDPLGNPLDFSTQYQPRDRLDVPTGRVTELPSIAASNAARAVNRDPAAMQRLQDQAKTEAMQQRTLDMQIEQDLVHQKAAKIRRQYEEETAGYDAQYQKWIKGQGPRPEYKTMEQWLTEKEGEKWGPLDHALTIASKASAAPIAGLTRLLDAPAALQQDRQPVGYGGRNTASDVMDRQLAGLEDNLKAEKVIQANKEKKDRFEAHSPEVQRILMGIGSDAEPAISENDLETFREDSGLRKDPTTWRKGIQGEINNAMGMGYDILVGTGHSLSGDIDTREANAAQEFGYTSAEQALATGLVSSGVLAGSKAAYKLVRTRMMLRAQRLQLLGKKVEQVEKAAKLEAKKAGKFTEALGGNEQLGIQAKKLSEAMRKDSLLIKAMQNGAEMAAEDVIEGTTESMIGSAQGAKSQMSFEGLTGNIVQEKTLDVGGQVLKKLATKLPELNRALKGLPPPPKGVTEAEFIKQVLPKLLKSDPKLLEEAAQHSNIKELGEAIRDMKLQDNSVTISPQEVLSVNPDYSNPETTTNLARLNDLAGKTGAKVRIAEATGYTEGASGRLLGENNGLIRLYGGATGGTLKEEAVHTVQQYLRSSDTLLGRVHDRLAREAERRIKALPANHPLKRELSKAFGRDITESPLTGDELMSRALMTNAGIKSASKAEDMLGKIVGVPPELQKVFETMLGKKLRQNKGMRKNKGLLTDEKPYDLTEEGQRRNEETSDSPIVRKNAIQPFVEGAEASPTESMKLDEYERQALEEADLRNNPSVAGSSDLDAYEQEQLDYATRQANPTITRRGLDAQERGALKEARLKAFPSTVPKGFDEHLSRIEENLKPLMRSAGYSIDNLSDVKKYVEEYPSNIASWYQKLREGEKAGTLDPAADLKEGYAKHVREVSSQREAGHSHQQSFDQDMTQVKPLVRGDDSPTVISLPPKGQFSLSQEGSEEFKKWFGGSKVVDGAGKPLPVFHGTRGLSREDFSVFEGEAVKSNWRQDAPEGFFFTDSPENANQYARGGGKMVEGKFEELSPRVKKVYLALQNPLVIDAGLPSTVEQVKKAGGLVRYISRKKESSKENPIDGVILKNYSDPIKSTTYIAFDPTQIKSATGNKGTFDKTNPDIRASLDTSENPLDMVAQGKDEKTKPKRKATPKAPKSDSLTAKERIVKSIRAMLRGYGSLPETFDIADAIENLNKKNRLKFYAELDQHMDSYKDDFYEVGVNPEQGEGREELIDKLKVWGNKNISNKEEWGTLQLLKDAPNAPFQVPETTTHQAQDLQGDWYIAQELVTIVPTPKGMAVYRDGKKIGQVKKEDMLHVDRIQVKEAPDVDPVQIPDDVYLDNDGDYDPIYSPIEDQELEDFRTYGVGRVSDTPSKKVTVADLNPRSLVTNAKTGAKLLFQPKEQLSPALKAELARPGEDYIGKLKGVGARGKAADFFKEQMAKLDYFFAQMYRELEKYEKDYPGELKKSAYMGARIMPASVAWQTSKKIDPVMRVITKRLADAGLKWDEAEQYAYAGAALERNQIKRDEDGVENASGISDDEAIAEMKRIANTPEKDKALKRVFGEVGGSRGIFQHVNDAKLNALVEVGLLQKDYAKELKKKYKFYVPMKTLERTPTSLVTLARAHTLNMVASAGLKVLSENETLKFLQKRQEAVIEDAALPPDVALDVEAPMDMSVKGHNMRVASGRATPADFPLSWAMRDAVNGIAKSERAKVQQVFLENIMEMGADPRFIEVLPPLVKRWVWAEKSTGKKLTKQQTMDLGLDQQYVRQQKDYKKVEGWFGEDGVEVPGHEVKYENEMIIAHGGRSYKLIANPANQTAMRAIKAMKQSDVYKMGALTKALSALNMWRSALLTRLNHLFMFTNLPKDFLGALTQTFIRQGTATTARFLVQWPIAWKHALQGKFPKGSAVYNDYKKHGGSIEFMRDSDVEQIMKKYDRQVRMLQAKGLAKVTPRQLLDLSLAALEFLNDVSDKVTRIAVYQAVVKSMPPEMKDNPAEVTKWKQKAALFSREATVDFNAKGVKTPLLSSIFLFGNPGVQAFRTMVGNFTTGDPSVTRRAAVLYSSALMMGVGLTYYNMMQGDDEETGNNRWDDIGSHNKASKIIILGKKAGSIAIPLMYGSTGFFFIMGEVLGSTLFSDKDDAADRVELAFKAVASSMPVQEILPSAVVPFWEIGRNEDYKGMPIVPEKPFSPYEVPDSEKFYRSTPEVLKSIARGLNKMTGAEDDKVKGSIDVSPATLNYWLAYLTGSVMNNANQIMRFKEGIEKTTGTEQKIPTQDIPILSKYTVANPEDRAIRTVYEAENEMQVTKARMRELSNQGKGKEARDFIRENYSDFWMLSAWEGISGTVSSIRSRREKGYIGQADPKTEEKVNQMKLNLARKWNQFKKGKEDFDKRYSEAKTDAEREELRKELRALIKRD